MLDNWVGQDLLWMHSFREAINYYNNQTPLFCVATTNFIDHMASSMLNQTTTASTELHNTIKAHEDYACVFAALEHKKYIKKPVKMTFLQKIKGSTNGRSFFNGTHQAMYSDIVNELKSTTGCNNSTVVLDKNRIIKKCLFVVVNCKNNALLCII
jgi:hypothetical protein